MTQASLSPDLHAALGAPPSVRDASQRSGPSSEAALWMIALTSSTLVIAAVLMFSLLASATVRNASLGGFFMGVGVVIAALGVGGMAYVLVTARRAGYLDSAEASAAAASVAPAGMHVVPAVPPDLGLRKRRQLEAERADRNRQAKAIATASAATAQKARPMAPRRPAPRPVAPPRPAPRPVPQRVVRSAPVRAPRPLPPRPAPQRPPAPPSRVQAPTRAPITMPRPQVHPPRPAAWPSRAPVVRMATPPMRPRTQAATFQVNAANVRVAAPARPR